MPLTPTKPGLVLSENLKKRLLPAGRFNGWLYKSLQESEPLLVARIGATEGKIIHPYISRKDLASIEPDLLNQIKVKSGINRTSLLQLKRFCARSAAALSNTDAIGIWNYVHQPELVAWSSCKRVVMLQHMNPMSNPNKEQPWTKGLEKKKVLVILPFVETLSTQFELIKKGLLLPELWPAEVEFVAVKPPVTFAGENKEGDWYDEFLATCARIHEQDFDVALVAAGGYGMILADYIKLLGKKAIHLGGSLQLLFGIMGGRWSEDKNIIPYVNSHWATPSSDERPKLSHWADRSAYY